MSPREYSRHSPSVRRTRSADGQALLIILVIMLAVSASAASFIWFMNQQQTRAGARYRSQAALHLAEAGVSRALSLLEAQWPEAGSPGGRWPPEGFSEEVAVGPLQGRFSVTFEPAADGGLFVASEGEAGGVVRRLRARVQMASPALLAGVYASSAIHFDRPGAALFVLPYSTETGDRRWVHVAAGEEIWFAQAQVALNLPPLPEGLMPGPGARTPEPIAPTPDPGASEPRPVVILLAGDAGLAFGGDRRRMDAQSLHAAGVRQIGEVLRTERMPAPPAVARDYFRSLALANAANAAINREAGRHAGNADLERKADSLYAPEQMAAVLAYLASSGDPSPLRGVVYVTGMVAVPRGSRISIADGALIADSTLIVEREAELVVTHGARTRTLPGIITLGEGAIVVAADARLRAHGLVYATRIVDTAPGARIEVVGALLGRDASTSIRINAATVVVRYDFAVLGTPGLRPAGGGPAVAWIIAWEEPPR